MQYDNETEIREPVAGATPAAPAHTTTIIREKRGSGGTVLAIVAVVGLLLAGFLYVQANDSEVMRDAAIADAAEKVGDSAQQAGQAVEDAANELTNE